MAQGTKVKHLRAVSQDILPVGSVATTVARLDSGLLSRRIQQIYHAVSPSFMPYYLRRRPDIAGLSPSFGAGLGQDHINRRLIVHIDERFLSDTMRRLKPSRHLAVVGHFTLAAAAHSFVEYRPEVHADKAITPHETSQKAWRWASALAIKAMSMNPEVEADIREAYRNQTCSMQNDYRDDMLMVLQDAGRLGVEPPKLRPVPAWTAVAYPRFPELT